MEENQRKESAEQALALIKSFVQHRGGDLDRGGNVNNLLKAAITSQGLALLLLPHEGVDTRFIEQLLLESGLLEEAVVMVIVQEYLRRFIEGLDEIYFASPNANKVREIVRRIKSEISREII